MMMNVSRAQARPTHYVALMARSAIKVNFLSKSRSHHSMNGLFELR